MASTTAPAQAGSSLATGVLYVHSCPKALIPHVEWALAREIGSIVKLDWHTQPLTPRFMRTVANWRGPAGTAASVASSLLGWEQLRFEISEDRSHTSDGGRWMHTPSLGIFHQQADASGNAVLNEEAIRQSIAEAGGDFAALTSSLSSLLGAQWDRELEPFRMSEEGDATIFSLHRVS